MPRTRGYDGLRPLPGTEVGAERIVVDDLALVADPELQRRAGVPVPDLGGVDAMPVRNVLALEQVVDRGRVRAGARDVIAEGLAIPAARGMALELEKSDDVVSGQLVVVSGFAIMSSAMRLKKNAVIS